VTRANEFSTLVDIHNFPEKFLHSFSKSHFWNNFEKLNSVILNSYMDFYFMGQFLFKIR